MGTSHLRGRTAACALLVTALLLTALPSLAAPGETGGQPPAESNEPQPPDPAQQKLEAAKKQAEAARAGVAAAEAGVARARAVTNAAEWAVKVLEEELVEVVREWKDARKEVDETESAIDAATEARRQAEIRRARERSALRVQAIEAYKSGSVQRNAMVLEVFQHAVNGQDLARNLYQLQSVVDHQIRALRRADRRLASARAVEEASFAAHDHALTRVSQAASKVAEMDAEVAVARDRAVAAEAALVDAMAQLVAARGSAAEASSALDSAKEEASPPPSAQPPPDQSRPAPKPNPDAKAESGEDEEEAPPPIGEEHVTSRRNALRKMQAASDDDHRVRIDAVCPVPGSVFTNDWHFDRHPHRRHEGTDMFAPIGAPIVAPDDLTVLEVDRVDNYAQGGGDLGGRTVTGVTEDGDRWYFAHLTEIADGIEKGKKLEAGDAVGTVGISGNAAGTPPHLHIGLYVGPSAINPYPTLRVACGDNRQGEVPESTAA